MSGDSDLIKVTHRVCSQARIKIQGFLSPRLMLFNTIILSPFLYLIYAGKLCNSKELLLKKIHSFVSFVLN